MKPNKTFKRELAVLLLVWLVYIVETKDVEVMQVLVWPVFSFAAAAFGFDAYGKLQHKPTQSPYGGRSESSSQRTGRENQLSDGRDDK